MKTLGDFLQKLHDLWGSPLEGLSLKAPSPGYVVMYKHVDSMTYEAVIVEKVGMFEEDDSFALWYLADVNLTKFYKVD